MSRRVRYTSGFANFLAILTVVIEVISGVALFMFYTIVADIPFIEPTVKGILLQFLTVLLVLAFFLTMILLYTPLYEFLPYVTKVFISALLAIFALLTPIVYGMDVYGQASNSVFLQFSFLSIVIFIAEVLILYAIYAIRGKKMLLVTRHRRALEEILNGIRMIAEKSKEKRGIDAIVDASNRAFQSWELIVRHELIERWDLSRIVFQALFISMAFYIASLAIVYSVIAFETLIMLATAIIFVFIIVLVLVDTLQSERMRALIK